MKSDICSWYLSWKCKWPKVSIVIETRVGSFLKTQAPHETTDPWRFFLALPALANFTCLTEVTFVRWTQGYRTVITSIVTFVDLVTRFEFPQEMFNCSLAEFIFFPVVKSGHASRSAYFAILFPHPWVFNLIHIKCNEDLIGGPFVPAWAYERSVPSRPGKANIWFDTLGFLPNKLPSWMIRNVLLETDIHFGMIQINVLWQV